ncbi:MAG TPA: DUF488 family protein [Burkholderiales bacterium]|nr:DUF488 family protein [Burkholderiales bacterium]
MIRVVRLGSPRAKGEGPRLGTVRRPPRGVKKADYAKRDYYDVWLPDLSPAQKTVSWATSAPWTDQRWRKFEKAYRREMRKQQHLLALLAALSHHADFSVGCYCEDENRCHRSILRTLLAENGARVG